MSAVEHFSQLEQEIGSLSLREEQLRNRIRQTVDALCAGQGYNTVPGTNGSSDVTSIPKRLTVVLSAKQYVQSLQELQEAVRDLERASREVVRAMQEGGSEYVEAINSACSCYLSAARHQSRIQPIPLEIQRTHLAQLTTSLIDRVKSSASSLKQATHNYVEERLHKCNWPPPLASASEAPPFSGPIDFWTKLATEEHPDLADIGTGMVVLTMLQQALEGKVVPGTVLWFMAILVTPIEQRLRMHFASDMSTADISKPGWLFATARKVIEQHGRAMQYFGGVLQAAGVEEPFDLELEFIRCMQSCVQNILCDYHIPQLAALGVGALWLEWTESTQAFDRELMQMTGITDDAGDLLTKFQASSCLAAFCRNKEWLTAWCQSEAGDIMQQMDDVMSSPDAWQSPSDFDVPEQSACNAEVWPPKCAEHVWGHIVTLVHRSKVLPGALCQPWVQQIGRLVLQDFHKRLVNVAKKVEAYKQLLEPNWAGQLCSCICAARYIAHNVQEWDDDEPTATSQAPLSTVFSKELNSFTVFKKEYSMKLARAVAIQFQTDSATYRAQLDAFSMYQGHQGYSPTSVSAAFVPALVKLRDNCTLLASMIDVVCFREIWKALAIATTRFLFNDIATEAKFSAVGAAQFQHDSLALMDVFKPYTSRPHTHLKELHEACLLVTMPAESARQAQLCLKQGFATPQSKQMLKSMGIVRLTGEQAMCILMLRLD